MSSPCVQIHLGVTVRVCSRDTAYGVHRGPSQESHTPSSPPQILSLITTAVLGRKRPTRERTEVNTTQKHTNSYQSPGSKCICQFGKDGGHHLRAPTRGIKQAGGASDVSSSPSASLHVCTTLFNLDCSHKHHWLFLLLRSAVRVTQFEASQYRC